MEKINFENLPSTNTPINAENLNQLQNNVEMELNEIKDGIREIVFQTILTNNSMSIDVTNLDIVRDGGEYEFILFHVDNGAAEDVYIRINDKESGYYYAFDTQSGTLTTSGNLTRHSEYVKNNNRFFAYTNSSKFAKFPAVMKGHFYLFNNNITYDLSNKLAVDGNQVITYLNGTLDSDDGNMNSLRFYKPSSPFIAGTKLIIKKKKIN